MNQAQLAAVLFAVVGVFVVGSALQGIFGYVALATQIDPAFDDRGPVSQTSQAWISALSFGLALLFGVALVACRSRLAVWLFPASSPALPERELLAVGLAIAGCTLAIEGASAFVPAVLSEHGWIDWGQGAKAALGVAVFCGAPGLSRLWERVRAPRPSA